MTLRRGCIREVPVRAGAAAATPEDSERGRQPGGAAASGDAEGREAAEKMPGVSGVILAGGASLRMGSNKALLPYRGGRFIEAIYRQLSGVFAEVFLVTNSPETFDFLPCRRVPDILPGAGALSGIHSGLYHSASPFIFAVACDMPYLNSGLVRHLAGLAGSGDVIIPQGPAGLEPLHAVYGRSCLGAIEGAIAAGEKRILSFFDRVTAVRIAADQIARFDPAFASFCNINTPEEYFRMRGLRQESAPGD
jgi:molybdopterin-guanine dinucleotide biosynthesis protein A